MGKILGYHASRPKYGGSTDCQWRGVFGNSAEVVTLEAKIEHQPSKAITASDLGQAHNQMNRALKEYGMFGFTVRATIVTHLTEIAPEAKDSVGGIKIIQKATIFDLWSRAQLLLSRYRDNWSLNDLSARLAAAQTINADLPETGWMIRSLDQDDVWING